MRILVVDSYSSSGAILARLLDLQGHQAKWARTIADALTLCDAQQFDLMISDLRLLDGSGAYLLDLLSRRCRLKAISLSADSGEDAFFASHQAGFAAHLVKPIYFDRLCDTLESLHVGHPGPV